MGIIKEDEIRGYHFESGEVVCGDCIKKEEKENLEGNQVLIDQDVDGDDLYFCDRCQKQL